MKYEYMSLMFFSQDIDIINDNDDIIAAMIKQMRDAAEVIYIEMKIGEVDPFLLNAWLLMFYPTALLFEQEVYFW